MMKSRSTIFSFPLAAVLIVLLAATLLVCAAEGDLKLEAQLVWGTNDQPKNESLKAVTPEIAKKLQRLPFKWERYFVMHEKSFSATAKDTTDVEMSKNCKITVKNLGDERIELTIIGKGKSVGKITQSLKNGHTLVTGGNAENFSGWFIVLRESK